MTQYNTSNLKLSNWQLDKLKSGITEVTLNLLSNRVSNCNDETSFPNKWLLTNTQDSGLHKAFANGSSANI